MRGMTPAFVEERGFRFDFFSNEASQMHAHASQANGLLKVGMASNFEITKNLGLPEHLVRAGRMTRGVS